MDIKTRFSLKSQSFVTKRNEDFQIDFVDFDGEVGSIGIIGKNGCGKSTFVEGLLGLLDHEGTIYVDGEAVQMSLCSYVMQDVTRQLFKESVAAEARFYNEASEEEVEAVLKFLSLDTKSDKHPQSLSGGEKQRISIARAMVKDAPIIMFDEATANVDPENEDKLREAIESLTEDKTVIMIAHRLKMIRNAD